MYSFASHDQEKGVDSKYQLHGHTFDMEHHSKYLGITIMQPGLGLNSIQTHRLSFWHKSKGSDNEKWFEVEHIHQQHHDEGKHTSIFWICTEKSTRPQLNIKSSVKIAACKTVVRATVWNVVDIEKVSMERQINIYSNIYTYLQIFESRYK